MPTQEEIDKRARELHGLNSDKAQKDEAARKAEIDNIAKRVAKDGVRYQEYSKDDKDWQEAVAEANTKAAQRKALVANAKMYDKDLDDKNKEAINKQMLKEYPQTSGYCDPFTSSKRDLREYKDLEEALKQGEIRRKVEEEALKRHIKTREENSAMFEGLRQRLIEEQSASRTATEPAANRPDPDAVAKKMAEYAKEEHEADD